MNNKIIRTISTIFYYVLMLFSFAVIGNYAGNKTSTMSMVGVLLIMALAYLIYFISIIIHEAGHLVFGLITKYKFSSFRVANLMILNNNGHFEFKKMTLAGTAGQCIMIPPETDNIPYILYNSGGIIFNLLFAIIGFILFLIVNNEYLDLIFFITIIVNLMNFLANGIPLKLNINNDMMNIVEFSRDKNALINNMNALYIQNLMIMGNRIKDIGSKYVYKPEKLETYGELNTMVLYCNQLMDKHEFKDCITEIESIINNDNLINIYRAMLINDLIYCYIVEKKDLDNVMKLKNRDMTTILKQMQNNPSVIRTNYAYSLLIENNNIKAEEYLNKFAKIEKSYPYKVDIESEKELIEIIKKINKGTIND